MIGALQLPDAQHHCGKQISTRGNQLFTNIINNIFQIGVSDIINRAQLLFPKDGMAHPPYASTSLVGAPNISMRITDQKVPSFLFF